MTPEQLARLLPPDVLRVTAELSQSDADALDCARRMRGESVRPAVEYRCGSGCLLLAGWATPRGFVLYFPAARNSRSYLRDQPWGGQGRGGIIREDDHAVHFGERARILRPGAGGVGVVCKHFWLQVSGDQILDHVREALESGRTVKGRLRHTGK